MYVGYSWPKVLQCPGPQGQYVGVFLDHTYLVAVSEQSIAVWSSGHARIRLGQHTLTDTELELYGRHVAACWSSDKGTVAVLTELGYLLVYDLHVTKHPALPALRSQTWGTHDGSQPLHAVDVYVKHPVRCERDVPATCVCCDSRVILIAYADGYWGSCSWFGKMHPDLYDISPDGLSDEEDIMQQQQQQPQPFQQQQEQQLSQRAAVHVHYCEPSRLLGVVFADGSAALFSPAGASQLQAQLVFKRWLCTAAAGATAVQIAAQAHLIALGTSSGVVHLLQQHCPTAPAADGSMTPTMAAAQSAAALSPIGTCGQLPYEFSQAGLDPQQLVRTLDLIDWGHTVKQTGAVASLCWAPDNRALAVGFSRQGLVVWTPSGCRLLCTLRQPAPDTPASGRASAMSPFRPDSSGSGLLRPLTVGSNDATAAANGTAGGSSSGSSLARLQHPGVVSIDGSVLCLAWGVHGYQLVLAGQAPCASGSSGDSHSGGNSSGIMYELSLAKSLRHHHRVTHASAGDGGTGPGVAQLGDELHVLQASDRLLLITEALTSTGPASFLASGMGSSDPSETAGGSSSDLHVHHVLLPAAYLAANWPLQHVAVSPCGGDIAAAGMRGLVVYNRKQERWRMFGEVQQERRVSCVALGWLSGCVVVASCSSTNPEPQGTVTPAAAAAAAAAVASAAASGLDLTRGAGAGFKCQLLLFLRNHLDFGSVVASTTLSKVPLAMDCTDGHVLLASAPLELLVLQLEPGPASGTAAGPSGAESSSGRPPSAPSGKARLVAVRELSLFNVGRPVQDVALVSAAAADMAHKATRGQSRGSASGPSTSSSKGAPRHAVLLRWGGMLSVLDLSRGAELMLADEVESFWLSDTLPVPTIAASSKAGSTCASAGHSRTSSIQGLPGAAAHASQDALAGLDTAGEEAANSSAGGVGAAHAGSSMSGSSFADPFAANMDAVQEVPEVVEMPWWAYGPVGMQLWFPSIVLAAMQLQTLHSSSSNSTLHSQASLPAQLTPHASTGLGPGVFIGGMGSRTSSGVPNALARSGSLWPPAGQNLQSSGGPMAAMAAAGAAAIAAAAAAANQPGSATSAAMHMKHAQSAPALAQDGAASAGGFQAIQYGTEIELEFDREVYPIGVSLADASIVGITQRVMRPQQSAAVQGNSPRAPRSSVTSRHHPLASQGSLPSASSASVSNSLALPCFLPVPESQPVLPALLRRLLQQGASPEALALAKRHEGGPHFKRSLEWLLFTTLDMEGSKCKPGKAAAAGAAGGASWQQQQPLHVLQGGAAGAAAGVLGRQGKGWLGHVDGQPHPVPVTPLLSAAVDLVLSFEQCLDVVVSVSRKTDASLWPALFSAVGSPSAVLELLLDANSLTSAACFLIVVDRLEGSHAAQQFAVQLIKMALKRGQFYLCAEILRFLIPPREGALQWGPGSPVDGSAKGAQDAAAAGGAPQKQPSDSAAAAPAGSGGWFSWIWGSSGTLQQQQQQQQPDKTGKQAAAGYPETALVSQSSLSAVGSMEHGSDACKVVADKAWRLLYTGKLGQLVQLIHSMSFLTGGLSSIMAAFRPQQGQLSLIHTASTAAELAGGRDTASASKQQQQQQQWAAAGDAAVLAAAADEGEVTVEVLIGCVLAAVEELPVWESTEVEQDAILVLDLVRELQIQRWTLALAVVLVDMSELGPFAAAQPELWQQFCGQLLEQPELYFLHQLVGALVTPGSIEEAMAAADEILRQQQQQQLLEQQQGEQPAML